jgi:hypothetical protein
MRDPLDAAVDRLVERVALLESTVATYRTALVALLAAFNGKGYSSAQHQELVRSIRLMLAEEQQARSADR